jgi:hypothetical protein
LLLRGLPAEVLEVLVVVGGLAPGVADALVHPGTLGPSPLFERGASGRVLLIGLASVPSRGRPLLEVRRVTTTEHGHLLLHPVELDDAVDGPGEELPVMAHEHGASPKPVDEPLQPVQSVEVQVVRRLVEQEDVVPGEQQRREAGACGLTTRQRGHGRRGPDAEAHLSEHRTHPVVEVRATEGEPAFQRMSVAVVSPRISASERVRAGIHLALRLGDSGTPGEEVCDRLARTPVGLLREIAHRGARRVAGHEALVRPVEPGEQAEKRRLPGAVGSDESDDLTWCDHEIQTGEQQTVAVPCGQVSRDEGGAHE